MAMRMVWVLLIGAGDDIPAFHSGWFLFCAISPLPFKNSDNLIRKTKKNRRFDFAHVYVCVCVCMFVQFAAETPSEKTGLSFLGG
jgi:hypothetical protein